MKFLLILTLATEAFAGCDYGHDKSYGWNKAKDDPTDAAAMKDLAEAFHFGDWHNKGGWELFVSSNSSTNGIFGSMCSVDNVCCDSIGGKNRVVSLKLERNNLKGKFPDTFSKLVELREIDAHLNYITDFPKGLETMPKLEQAKFGRNPITGTVPQEWKNFGPQLTKLNCNFCALEGEFPDMFDNLPNLEEAYWCGNGFTGSLPPSLAKLKGLTKISFNLNSFTGAIPAGLCELPLLHDCRIGNDMDFAPYDTSSGSPEKKWLKKWEGNVFSSCPAGCVKDDICNNGGSQYQPGHYGPKSPLKCTGPAPPAPPTPPTPPSPPPPGPSPPTPPKPPSPPPPGPSGDCSKLVSQCFDRCEKKYGGKISDIGSAAENCAKGCAGMNKGQVVDKSKICGLSPASRQANCQDGCESASSHAERVAECKYGCGFWSSEKAAREVVV